jgi:hypothetical protein
LGECGPDDLQDGSFLELLGNRAGNVVDGVSELKARGAVSEQLEELELVHLPVFSAVLELLIDPEAHDHEVGESNRFVAELLEVDFDEVCAQWTERVGDGLQLNVPDHHVFSQVAVLLREAELDEGVLVLGNVSEHHEAQSLGTELHPAERHEGDSAGISVVDLGRTARDRQRASQLLVVHAVACHALLPGSSSLAGEDVLGEVDHAVLIAVEGGHQIEHRGHRLGLAFVRGHALDHSSHVGSG